MGICSTGTCWYRFIGTDVTSSTVIYIGSTCDLVEFFTNILNLSDESRCCLNV